MFWKNLENRGDIFSFFTKSTNYEKSVKLIEIDFKQSWWQVLWQQKLFTGLHLFNVLLLSIVGALSPILIAQAFTSRDFTNFGWIILILIGVKLLNQALFWVHPLLVIQSCRSIETSSVKFFLSVDPVFHATKSGGQIISKINRGSNSCDTALNIASFNLIDFFGATIGILIAFARLDFRLALVVAICLGFLICLNSVLFISVSKFSKQIRIADADAAKAGNIETLNQAQFIRAVFATNEQNAKITKLNLKSVLSTAVSYRIAGYIVSLTQICFFLTLLLIAWFLYQLNLDVVISTSVLISYFMMTYKIEFFGHEFGRFLAALDDIDDLFEFIRNFGQQTFPVFEELSPLFGEHPSTPGKIQRQQ